MKSNNLAVHREILLDGIQDALRFHFFTNGTHYDKIRVETLVRPTLDFLLAVYESAIRSNAILQAQGGTCFPLNPITARRFFLQDLATLLVDTGFAADDFEDEQIVLDELGPQIESLLQAFELSAFLNTWVYVSDDLGVTPRLDSESVLALGWNLTGRRDADPLLESSLGKRHGNHLILEYVRQPKTAAATP